MKNQGFAVHAQEKRGIGAVIKPFAVVAASSIAAGVLVVALGAAIDKVENKVFANWKPAPEKISIVAKP